MRIAGSFGKHCGFESHGNAFQSSLDWCKGGSVAGLIVQSVSPCTGSKQPLSLRVEAFDRIDLVCQSRSHQFTQKHTSDAFKIFFNTRLVERWMSGWARSVLPTVHQIEPGLAAYIITPILSARSQLGMISLSGKPSTAPSGKSQQLPMPIQVSKVPLTCMPTGSSEHESVRSWFECVLRFLVSQARNTQQAPRSSKQTR